MIIKANCKINIGLNITARREDGFHDLETLMYPISDLYDILDIQRMECGGVQFKNAGLAVDCPEEQNICIKAFRLMQREHGVDGVSITLDKRIPFGAGLGGGSSDAASVLLAINDLFNLSLCEQQLIDYAAELGSDVPFFIRNRPQLCTGRGEVMSDLDIDLKSYRIELIKPDGVNISTREAYAGVKPAIPTSPLSDDLRLPIEQWQGVVKNDFERSLFPLYPQLSEIKQQFIDRGAIYASMSGSGSTIYGIFDSTHE
ncbi:MAG: 4-(cytidine 5'-diphospho)-2-C-methyl-D-erythritol kinase [Rikenellaceae bacterium]